MPELIQLDTLRRSTKIALISFLVMASVWSFYAFRWYLGETLAEYFNVAENNLELAGIARNLAPGDPLTHWRLGQVSQKKLPLDQSSTALAEFEKAVSLSPVDYRFWMALGTAREQAGDVAGAEPALRQAISLAPAYAYPHWYLGNLLLRNNRYDEAFVELRKASEAAPEELRPQLFNLIWEIYGNDFESLKKAVGDSAEARANFSAYLLDRAQPDLGLGLWNSLSSEDKKANKETGEVIIRTLVGAQRFHDALLVWNDLAVNPTYRTEEGQVTDGSFEDFITYGADTVFGWQVKTAAQMEIGIDPNVSHSGARSLLLAFNVRSQLDAIFVSQLIPVARETTYDFECFVRTAKLQSGGPPVIQLMDANAGNVLAASSPAPTGDNDWNRIVLTFKTTGKTEAITLRITRASCDDNKVCPIFGTVWYDDFSLNRHK